MADNQKLRERLILRLFDAAQLSRTGSAEFTGKHIMALMHHQMTPPITTALVEELVSTGLLRQTRAIADDNDGQYQLTARLIAAADRIRAGVAASKANVGANSSAAAAAIPRPSFRGVKIAKEQFFDLMVVAVTQGDADGTGKAPWDLELVADREGFVYEPEWIEEFANTMENSGADVIRRDIKSTDYPSSKICAYPNDSAYQAAPLLRQRYYGILTFEGYPNQVLGRGLSIPASNRTVTLDHNSQTYKEAVASLDTAIETVRGDNEYAVEEPEDHRQRLAELEAGKRLLDAPKIDVSAARETLVRCLKYLAEKFVDHAIGLAAGAAITALLALLGVI